MSERVFEVYLLRCEDWFKVGVTIDLGRRFKELRGAMPFDLHFVASCGLEDEGDKPRAAQLQIERWFHSLMELGCAERRGEWFKFPDHALAKETFQIGTETYEDFAYGDGEPEWLAV